MRILAIDAQGDVQGLPIEPMPFVRIPRIARVDVVGDEGSYAVVLSSTAFGTEGWGDIHSASRWQVSTELGFTMVPDHDTGESTDDRRCTVVSGLTSGETYYARVCHRAEQMGLSQWSPPFEFIAP